MLMAPVSKYSPDNILNLGGDGAIVSFELSSAALRYRGGDNPDYLLEKSLCRLYD